MADLILAHAWRECFAANVCPTSGGPLPRARVTVEGHHRRPLKPRPL